MKIPPFRLERYLAEHEFKVRHLLCASDCETVSVEDLFALEPGSAQAFLRLRLGYTDSQGGPELRAALSALYSKIEPRHLLCTAGAEEAIFLFMNVALSPGDHLIVHAPHYQSLSEIARSLGAQVTAWETSDEDGWELDLVRLRASLRPNTRAIVVNCPHNPTGYLMSEDKQKAIVALARENALYLFSDEVYRGLEADERDRLPPACDRYEHAVSLGVMSKSFGLAGLRIGWLASRDEELLGRMAAYKDYLSICSSAPGEWLATLALKHRETLLTRNRELARANRELLAGFLQRHRDKFRCVLPKAGCIAFVRYLGSEGARAYAEKLLTARGVLLLPGSLYAYADAHFRVGFGRASFKEGLAAWEAFES